MKPLVSNIQFIVQPLPKENHSFLDEEEKFQEKLLRLSESAFSTHSNNLSPIIRVLQEHIIQDCAVGPEHLAFLLENGSICRITYTTALKNTSSVKLTEDLNKEKGKSGTRSSKMIRTSSHSIWSNMDILGVTGSGSLNRWGSRGSVVRPSGFSGSSSSTKKTTQSSSNSNSSEGITSSGIRLIRASQVRGRNPLFSGGQKVVVPASHVPEELINQVQNVLQGKSRSVILRELQRTHLDVNMAVNNLLSRDDEDNDDMEDGASDYIPGEELMSLLDGGMPPGDHARVVIDADAVLQEDLLGYTFASRGLSSSNRRTYNEDSDESASRTSSVQWSETKGNSSKSTVSKESDLILGDFLEWWKDGDNVIKFKCMGSMHSDLIGVGVDGTLYQWKWKSDIATRHPQANSLKLNKEKISFLATSMIQASVVTEGGAIATWMDASVSSYASPLNLPCTNVDAFRNEQVKSLHVCSSYSAVLTEQGRVYWWGIPPYNQRKKLIEKSQSSFHQNLGKDSSGKQNLSVGDYVCLRSYPMYHAGALAVNVSGGFPKIGKLLHSVWEDPKGDFQIISPISTENSQESNSKEDEKMAEMYESGSNERKRKLLDNASTSEATESSNKVNSRKRKRSEDDDDYEEEVWDLKEILFIDDSRSLPVGKIAKVDGNILAVHFCREDFADNEVCLDKLLSSCRLLQKDEVIPIKTSPPKSFDYVQRVPRKVAFDHSFHLHCINAGEGGIIAVASHGRDLNFIRLSLSSGKITCQKKFPTKADSFFSRKNDGSSSCAKLLNCGSSAPILLQDYNSMLCPLVGDENGGIRDPIWADISPLHASGMGFSFDSFGARSTVVVLAFRSQVLMPLIMSRDLKGFQSLLTTVENNEDAAWAKIFYQSLLNERCDGQRNILHMCIEMSVPSTNKEQREDEEAQTKLGVKHSPSTRSSPVKPTSTKASVVTTETTTASFMSEGDRISAVNAIANAISSVRGSSSGRESTKDNSSSNKSPSYPPIPPPFLPDRSEQSNSNRPKLSSSENPITSWPCDASSWRLDDRRDEEEEGMNLTVNNSKKLNKDPWTEVLPSDRGSRPDAVAIIKLICKSKCIQPYLKDLLRHKDSLGYTPFMFAVAHRAYPAALEIFKAAFSVSIDPVDADETTKKFYDSHSSDAVVDPTDQTELLSMLYPPNSDPDDNPMYMLCCNDTCSFTWTGALHINQDIFECLTCGLTETLCCCTECARVCHKGHDCKLKRTSPTAYCDCWEKCACKSLVEGSTPDRIALLRVLLHTTDLYERYNSQGEHIIHFLIQTVARQCEEQRQYRPVPRSSIVRQSDEQRLYRQPSRTARMSTSSRPIRHRLASRTLPSGGDQDMPEHDLRPPQFCREALLQLLSDWHAVRSLLFGGCDKRRDKLSVSSKLGDRDVLSSLLPEDEWMLGSQSGVIRLDAFTHTILVRCLSSEYLDRLLETLIHAVQVNKHRDHDDGVIMARRFLRSVIRVFIILTSQSTPDKLAARLSLYNQSALAKCRRAFTALITLSIEELCETAEALITPVRLGVAKPTCSFSLFSANTDIMQGSSTVFSKQPFAPRTHLSDEEDDGDRDKHSKPLKKSRKKSKRSKNRRVAIDPPENQHPESSRTQEPVNEDESDQNIASQDTQTVEDEPMDGLRRLFRDISDQIEGEGREDDLVEEESDMDITDLELATESVSDTDDSDEQPTMYSANRRSNDRESQHDEEDEDAGVQSKAGKNEEEDTDSDEWQEENNLERRSTREQRTQARETPHAMQWAMGTRSMVPVKRPGSSGSSSRPPVTGLGGTSNNGVIYVSSRSMRRNESSLENPYLNNVLDRHSGRPPLFKEDSQIPSSSITNAQLSRLFGTCIREVVHLLASLQSGSYLNATTLGTLLEVSYQESSDLRDYVQDFLERTWNWLLIILESTESQLHYGQILSMASSPNHPDHPRYKGTARRSRVPSRHHGNATTNEDAASRLDFLSYVLSLMRSHNNEHSDILPSVDISSLKHIAYVLDAYVYYLRVMSRKDEDEGKSEIPSSSHNISLDICYDNSDNEEEDDERINFQDDLYSAALQSESVKISSPSNFPDDCSSLAQPPARFFHRSESMTFLGCSDSNTFDVPLSTSLPLAEKPHILRPSSRKEELFGRSRKSVDCSKVRPVSMSLSTRLTSLGASRQSERVDTSLNQNSIKDTSMHSDDAPPPPYSSVDPSTSKDVSDLREPSIEKDISVPRAVQISDEPTTPIVPDIKDGTVSDNVNSKMEIDDALKEPDLDVETPPAITTVTVDMSEDPAESSKSQSTKRLEKEIVSAQSVLARCRLVLELFSRMFIDSVGAESKSILHELGGFEVREVKFRQEMDRLRTSQTIDLHLNVERNRELLIHQTFKQLNQQAKRRSGSTQPIAALRVKVQFENEPGEGTGVARSFYTAIAEALISNERLPCLDGVLPGSTSSSQRKSSSMHLSLVARLYKREREREERSGRAGSSRTGTSSSGSSERSINLRSFLTARYRELTTGGQRESSSIVPLSTQASPFVKRSSRSNSGQSSLERSKQAIGDRLYPKVAAIHSSWSPKITGMLLELPAYELLLLLRSERSLHERVSEAVDLLLSSSYSVDGEDTNAQTSDRRSQSDNEASTESRGEKKADEKSNKTPVKEDDDNATEDNEGGPPLFYQPGKRGMYAPASWGDTSDLRLNAYRNVGRIIGLCLLQNELCPLPLCRHVLKVLLGRKIHWHDLAFFDPVLYESFRQLIVDSQSSDDDVLEAVGLTFLVDLQNEEGGGQVELIPGGGSISVTKDNIMDYVRRYALYRMVSCCRKQLDKMRQGMLDVISRSSIQNLSSEDLRLLFNGCGHVDVHALISYTMFNDESGKSGSSAEKLTQFKRWFWAVVDKMSQLERQDLLYFWTGSPALPASEDGFQPMPTITIRPSDDHHLPTANTCISRLYVPLYSSKHILRQKLLIAIKTKNFGFV